MLINSLLEKADCIHKQLQIHRTVLESLLVQVTEHCVDRLSSTQQVGHLPQQIGHLTSAYFSVLMDSYYAAVIIWPLISLCVL